MRTIILAIVIFLLPSFVFATIRININSADAVLLDTLPSIGPTYAARIVDYRTTHGPFASIEDIQKVSGIGPSTYADISSFITVSDAGAASVDTVTATSTVAAPVSENTEAYVPPPSALSVQLTGSPTALQEVPQRFSARVTTKGGVADARARIQWSFGDGSASEGSFVEKTYTYAGTYLVVVTATDGSVVARDSLLISVKQAEVRIVSITGDGFVLENESNERLDMSGWRLLTDANIFRFPEGTTLLPHVQTLFPYAILNFPISFTAIVEYPNGVVASRFVPVKQESLEQPVSKKSGSSLVQQVEVITNVYKNTSAHEEAVNAPAPISEKEIGAGAVLAQTPALAAAVTAETPSASLSHSVWTLGLLGVMTLAAGVFVLL